MPATEPRWTASPRCTPFVDLFDAASLEAAQSWEQIEVRYLAVMSEFDSAISSTATAELSDEEKSELTADLQNGKGDFFNDLLALLLENCAGIGTLSTRGAVPGLIVPKHNLDGVFPDDGPIRFMLEAKATGTPKHANNKKQKNPLGRRASADLGKRVKELAFKSIDLKAEFSRLRTSEGRGSSGSAAGGDLTTWLRGVEPKIYFFMSCRVLSESDLNATIKWAQTAQQVVDAVGLFCFRPVDGSLTDYERVDGLPTELQIDRVLFKACRDLQAIASFS